MRIGSTPALPQVHQDYTAPNGLVQRPYIALRTRRHVWRTSEAQPAKRKARKRTVAKTVTNGAAAIERRQWAERQQYQADFAARLREATTIKSEFDWSL